MSIISGLFDKVFSLSDGVIPVFEAPGGAAVNAKGSTDGYQFVDAFDAADKTITYASSGAISADVDLYAAGGNKYPRRIRIGVGGTAHFVYADNSEDTITYQSGDIDAIKAKTIKSGSTAQMITVYW